MLIDDVPGVGKTTLVRMLASLLGLQFARVQFTPDLMPSDITGTSILNMKTQDFEFRPGPIFTQILLADEINRATPKTQAALLEAMQERQVTVDGVTYPLPDPFFVLATQNPVELEGTFPLPEAQLDRFLLRVGSATPTRSRRSGSCTVGREHGVIPASPLPEVARPRGLRGLVDARSHRAAGPRATSSPIARATREHPDLQVGASPRADRAHGRRGPGRGRSCEGRDYVLPDDVKALAGAGARAPPGRSPPTRGSATAEPKRSLADVLERVPVPVEFQGA